MSHDPSSKISYRDATPQDIDALRRFEQYIVSAERAFDPTLKDGPIEYYDIENMLLANQARFVVAENSDQVVACGFARIDDAKAHLSHAQQAYLGLMYVDPRYRGRSLNAGLLQRLKEWCLARGVTELRLEVYSDNLAAIKAYEKSGFSRHMIEMRLKLNQ